MAAPEREIRHRLDDADFRFICELVYQRSGIVLGEHKREMVCRRLLRRTRSIGCDSFGAYCALLKDERNGELPALLNAITTNLTSFFRESHHFDYLREVYLPELLRASTSRRLRIWSAGCSTGEEPYSIAITLQQVLGQGLADWDALILATDLDTDVLATARAGVYRAERIAALADDVKRRWFLRGTGDKAEQVRVRPELAHSIRFKPLNLLEPWPMRGPFDVIFCRNVIIYFDKARQQELIRRFHGLLRPGGLLLLGHSENLGSLAGAFQACGRTLFRKPVAGEEI